MLSDTASFGETYNKGKDMIVRRTDGAVPYSRGMYSIKALFSVACAVVAFADANAALTVVQRGSGFRIDRDGKTLVMAVAVENGKKGEVGKSEAKMSFCESPR